MSAGHTLGPWVLAGVSEGGFDIWSAAPDADGSYIICARNPIPHRADQSEANARLIAAAPDLLAALVNCMDILGRAESNASGMGAEWDYVGPRVAAARAAIAKATGQ